MAKPEPPTLAQFWKPLLLRVARDTWQELTKHTLRSFCIWVLLTASAFYFQYRFWGAKLVEDSVHLLASAIIAGVVFFIPLYIWNLAAEVHRHHIATLIGHEDEKDTPPELPKLDYSGPEMHGLASDSAGSWVIHELSSRRGLLVKFTNPINDFHGGETPNAEHVTAHLLFHGNDGKDVRIDNGCWMDRYENWVDFGPGKTHALIITQIDNQQSPVFTVNNPRAYDPVVSAARSRSMRKVLDAHERRRGTDYVLMEMESCQVDIRLVDKYNRTVYSGAFIYKLQADRSMRLLQKI